MANPAGYRYQFGPFEANIETGELCKRGQRIRVQEQPFRLLAVLLENAGEIVSRDQIQARIWPEGTFVDFDSGLRVAVRKLREVLGDDADDPRYIETIPKRGYRFLYPVARPDDEVSEPEEASKPDAAPTAVERSIASAPALAASPQSKPFYAKLLYRRPVKYGAVAVTLAALAAAGLLLWHRTVQARPLTDKDVLVLADFTNSTGDPVFDDTLRQALAIQLEQSPFLKIMDDEQANQTLGLMGLHRGAHITNQIAHDICVRNAAAATIDGSIASIGKSYVITLHASTCQNGATLAREQSQADDKEHVLHALQTAGTTLRGKLGESRSSIQKLNLPLEQATSGSLEALKSYSTGIQILTQGRFLDARPFFEHAVALDPKFAMAYSYLATACGNAGDTQCQRDYERKAFALIDRVSERERPYIAGGYYDATGELEKELAVTRVGVATYPRVWSFHNSISEVDIILGQFEDGVREAETASQLQPDGDPPYRRVLDADMDLDRLDAANKTVNTLRSRNLGGARLHQRFLELAYAQDDETAAAKEIQWFAGKPEEYLSFGLQAAYLNVKGERRESAKLYQQAAQSALSQNLKELSAQIEEANALAGALWGDCDQALRLRRPALALAMCGNEAGARKLIAETSGQFPNGLIWNKVELPAIRAAIESHNGRPERAIELLASAAPYEGAYPQVAYLRGVALLHLKKGSDAAVEFRKITEHKGRSWGTTWYLPDWGLYYPVASLSLARALAEFCSLQPSR